MRIVIVEHLLVAKKFAPHLLDRWPGEQIVLMPLMNNSINKPVYPRGIAYSQFPVIMPMDYRPVPETRRVGEFNNLYTLEADGSISKQSQTLEEASMTMEGASVLSYMGDWDYTGVWGMESLKTNLAPSRCIPIEVYRFQPDYKMDGVDVIIPEPVDSSDTEYQELLNAAVVKRYFDFNFYLNSSTILGKLYREVFGGSDPHFIGRSGILLIMLAGKIGVLLIDLQSTLRSWKGTGKYNVSECRFFEGMGTNLSRFSASGDLVRLKILTNIKEPAQGFVLTDQGREFVSRLHKDCFDQDLPFRLNAWMGRPFDEVKPAMDQYILTYFRKQQRFQYS